MNEIMNGEKKFPKEEEWDKKYIVRVRCSQTKSLFYIIFTCDVHGDPLGLGNIHKNLQKLEVRPGENLNVSKFSWETWQDIYCPYCEWRNWPPVIQCLECGELSCGRYDEQQGQPIYVCSNPDCNNQGLVKEKITHLKTLHKKSK